MITTNIKMTESLVTNLNFTRLCRCCASEHNLMYDIFCGTCSNAQTYYEVVMECAPVELFRDNGLPSLICHKCVLILESFIMFRRKCVESELILKRMSSSISLDEQETFDLNRVGQDDSMLVNVKEEMKNINGTTEPETELKAYDKIENLSDKKSDFEIKKRSFDDSVYLKQQSVDDDREPYTCNLCDKSFGRKINLDRHRKTHTGQKLFSCGECGKSFNLKSNRDQHRKTHTDEKLYSCSECDRSFNLKSNFHRHQRIHTGEKPYSCGDCGKSFSLKANLNVHRRIHTDEKQYSCDVCGKSFKFKSNFNRHRKVHADKKSYSCGEGGKSFKRKPMSSKHRRTHTGEQPYACDECDKSFSLKSYLKQHQRIHTGDKSYSCDTCEKLCISKSNLKQHQRKHSDEKPFPCDRCNKSFKFKSHLIQHRNTHMGESELISKQISDNVSLEKQETFDLNRAERDDSMLDNVKEESKNTNGTAEPETEFDDPKKNSITEKCFESKVYLSNINPQIDKSEFEIENRSFDNFVYVKEEFIDDVCDETERPYLDTEDRPYTCDLCDKSFERKINLDRHRKIHTGDTPYRCGKCGKSFNLKSNFHRHQRMHTGEKPYTCGECGKSFSLKANLKVHQRIHTDEMQYACDRCDKSFKFKSNFNRHQKVHVGKESYSDRLSENRCSSNTREYT